VVHHSRRIRLVSSAGLIFDTARWPRLIPAALAEGRRCPDFRGPGLRTLLAHLSPAPSTSSASGGTCGLCQELMKALKTIHETWDPQPPPRASAPNGAADRLARLERPSRWSTPARPVGLQAVVYGHPPSAALESTLYRKRSQALRRLGRFNYLTDPAPTERLPRLRRGATSRHRRPRRHEFGLIVDGKTPTTFALRRRALGTHPRRKPDHPKVIRAHQKRRRFHGDRWAPGHRHWGRAGITTRPSH